MTIPGDCFGFGITLDSFDVNTRDKNWNESFIKKGSSREGINKLAKIKNFGVYWNPRCRSLASLHFHAWVEAMQRAIYTESMQCNIGTFANSLNQSPVEYILLPTNCLVVKIVHFEHAPENVPRLDVVVEITHLQLTLDKLQFLQLTETLRLLSMLEKQQQLLAHRPKFRPNKDPRSWWIYAVKLVCKNEEMFSHRIENMMFCMQARKRYIYLLRRRKEEEALIADDMERDARDLEMSYIENEELNHLESILPLYTLVIFRQLATVEEEPVQVQVQGVLRSHSGEHSFSPGGSPRARGQESWWGWMSNTVTTEHKEVNIDSVEPVVVEGDVNLDYIRMEMEKSYFPLESPKDAISLRLKLSSSASLNLNNNKVPVVEANMNLSFAGVTKAEATSLYFAIENFIVKDRFTRNSVIENIVSVKNDLDR